MWKCRLHVSPHLESPPEGKAFQVFTSNFLSEIDMDVGKSKKNEDPVVEMGKDDGISHLKLPPTLKLSNG